MGSATQGAQATYNDSPACTAGKRLIPVPGSTSLLQSKRCKQHSFMFANE